jgi:hypothetical protein
MHYATSRKVTASIPDEINEFSIYLILTVVIGPGIDSTFNTNEYQKVFLGVTP